MHININEVFKGYKKSVSSKERKRIKGLEKTAEFQKDCDELQCKLNELERFKGLVKTGQFQKDLNEIVDKHRRKYQEYLKEEQEYFKKLLVEEQTDPEKILEQENFIKFFEQEYYKKFGVK